MNQVTKSYIPYYDGIRAFAFLIIFLNHINENLIPHGYLGVDIFFVVSGFFISKSLISSNKNNLLKVLFEFYIKRLTRILPALIFMVLICIIFAALFLEVSQQTFSTGSFSLIGISNLYLYLANTDYFKTPAFQNLFIHTWSLGVEEQFYIFFPILYVFIYSFVKSNSKFKLTILLSVIAFISLALYLYFLHKDEFVSFYMMPARFWQFYLGYILFSYKCNFKHDSQILNLIVFGFIISMLFIDYVKLNSLLITLLMFYFACSLKEGSVFYKTLTSAPITLIGKYSYSLYLWHWPVIAFSYIFLGQTPYTIIVIILLTLLFSFLSYKFIESPFRYHNINLHKLIFILLVWVLSFSFSYLLMNKYFPEIYLGDKKFSTRSTFTSLDGFKDCRFLKNNYEKLKYCEKQSLNNDLKKTIYFTGDSISESLGILGYSLHKKFDVSINPKFRTGCLFPFAFHYTYGVGTKSESKYCKKYSELRINEIIENGKRNDLVINANWYSFLLSHETFDKGRDASPLKMDMEWNQISHKTALKLYEKSLVDLSNILERKGIKLVILLPQLQMKEDLINCRYEFFQLQNISPDCKVNKDQFLKFRQILLPTFINARKKTNNLILWDPINVFCKNNLCGYFQNGDYNLYYDREHFSEYGAQMLFPNFLKTIEGKVTFN